MEKNYLKRLYYYLIVVIFNTATVTTKDIFESKKEKQK